MLQIEIPKELKELNKKKNVIVGIDLGTTNSLIAYVDNGTPKIIANIGEDKLVPSVIYIDKEKNILIGSEAKKHLITDTDNYSRRSSSPLRYSPSGNPSRTG